MFMLGAGYALMRGVHIRADFFTIRTATGNADSAGRFSTLYSFGVLHGKLMRIDEKCSQPHCLLVVCFTCCSNLRCFSFSGLHLNTVSKLGCAGN